MALLGIFVVDLALIHCFGFHSSCPHEHLFGKLDLKFLYKSSTTDHTERWKKPEPGISTYF